MNKIVQSPMRSRLTHPRLRKLLYCFVNLRLLDNVDEDLDDMISSAVDHEIRNNAPIDPFDALTGSHAKGPGHEAQNQILDGPLPD